MAEYKIQDFTLTNLADKIRILSGTTDAMGTTAMGTSLDSANSEVDTQTDLIAQITAALEGKTAGSSGVIETCLVTVPSISSGYKAIEYVGLSDDGVPCRCRYNASSDIYTETTFNIVKGTMFIIGYQYTIMSHNTSSGIDFYNSLGGSTLNWWTYFLSKSAPDEGSITIMTD